MPASDYYINKGETWSPKYQAFVNLMYGAISEPLNGSSTSSLVIGTGSKSLTIEIEKSFTAGQPVRIFYDSSNYMDGTVTSYDSTTGALVVNVTTVTGSGTYAVWAIGLVGSTFQVGLTYTELTGTTSLVANSYNVDKSGASNIQTLPDLSTLSDGDKVEVYVAVTDRTVIVNEHANDSNAEIWTGVAVGDFVRFVVVDGAWHVSEHYESHYCRVYVNADESIVQGASEQISGILETTDKGGIWNTTNNELDIPFNCFVDLRWLIISVTAVISEAKLGTAYIRNASAAGGTAAGRGDGSSLTDIIEANALQKLQLWGFNKDTDSGNALVLGDAAGNESFATIKLTRVY